MKLNKLFHWLYFIVMMLPIFAMPIYAIYVRNENSTYTEQLEVEENKVVDFNQYVDNGNITSFGLSYSDLSYYTTVSSQSFAYFEFPVDSNSLYRFSSYINLDIVTDESFICALRELNSNKDGLNYRYITVSANYNDRFITTFTTLADTRYLRLTMSVSGNFTNNHTSFYKSSAYNLSKMGLTNDEFVAFYPLDYYDYTLSDIKLLKNYSSVTYNDTDVMSQFTYNSYNMINKYFNFDSVFNFGSLYDWLQLTFFNGNATLGFFIMWHLLIYWLLTSLLWLLFDVLIYVPMLIHRWLDKASLS